MSSFRSILKVCALLVFTLALSPVALAQTDPSRRFVSSAGSDANPCTEAMPCRTFQAAVTAAPAGGEVIALTSGGFSPFTVNKSLTISGDGVHAGITTANGTNGITINPPASAGTVVIRIRSLKIEAPSTASVPPPTIPDRDARETEAKDTPRADAPIGAVRKDGAVPDVGTFTGFGILVSSGIIVLHVENCVIDGFSGGATSFNAGILFTSGGQLFMKDTVVSDNFRALDLEGTIFATIENSRFEENTNSGIALFGDARMTVRHSVVARAASTFGGFGILLNSIGGSPIAVVEDTKVTLNGNGFRAVGSSIIDVSSSTIAFNDAAIIADPGSQINSRGNNTLSRNGSFEAFTGSFLAR